MKLPLSKRLLTCCGFVSPGDRVADIGCDHGYLGIYLLLNQIASSVIAADIRPMPLDSAVRNARKFGVADRMRFYLSDGAAAIPRDFDTLVCAGMGGDTMASILEAAPWLKSRDYRLILQCQSKTPMLRRYLTETGWRIAEEPVIRDGRFLYTVMEVWWEPTYPKLTAGEWYMPPAMFENPSNETVEYYHQTVRKLRLAVHGQGENVDSELVSALQELESLCETPELSFLKEKNHDNSC